MARMLGTKRLEKAIAHNKTNDQRQAFQITYKKLNGRTVKRKVDPLEIKGNLLVGWDHKRQAIRSYKLERMQAMKKHAFLKGFEKEASALGHTAELVGLGVLAAPSIMHLMGKKMKENTHHKMELAGLATLAAPSLMAMGNPVVKGMGSLFLKRLRSGI